MNNQNYLFEKPNLMLEKDLSTFVENETKFSLNNCEFSIYETHKSAFGVKLHFEELSFTGMLRGKKHMKLENKTNYFDYLPGESVLVSPGETMLIDFPDADEAPSQCISISLNPEFIKNSLNNLNLNHSKIDENSSWKISLDEYYLFNNQSLASATNNLMRIAMDNNAQKDIIADFALKELLIRLMQTQARSLVEKNINKNNSRIALITDYIKNNLHHKLSVEEISKMAFVSKSNLFKLFKEELGISPNDYIIQERIKKAKELLVNHRSVKEVAFMTGFADTNYFTRVFRQLVGETPKQFQKNSELKID